MLGALAAVALAVGCGWRWKPAHIWRTATWGVAILLGCASGKLQGRGKLMATLEWHGATGVKEESRACEGSSLMPVAPCR